MARALTRSRLQADRAVAVGALLAEAAQALPADFVMALDIDGRTLASASASADCGGVGLRRRGAMQQAGLAMLDGEPAPPDADIQALPLMADGRIVGAIVLHLDDSIQRSDYASAVQLLASCVAGILREPPVPAARPRSGERGALVERLMEALAAHREGMALFGPDRGLIAANAAFTAAHGASVRELKGLTLEEILRRDHGDGGPVWVGRDIAERNSGVELALAADGRWLRLSRARTSGGDELVVQTPADDELTRLADARRRGVDAANAVAERARIWDGLAVGVVLLSEASRVLDANPEAVRLLRVERADLVGRRLSRISDRLSDEWAVVGRARAGGPLLAARARRLPNRQALLVLTQLPEAEPIAPAETQAADLVANPALGELGHEMRTPLNAVIGFAEIMLARSFGPVNERQAQYLEDIVGAGRHMLEMVDHMVDHAQLAAGRYPYEPQWAGVRALATDAVRLLEPTAAKGDVRLILRPVPDLEAYVDRRSLLQALINLLSNAVKFTPAGGQASLSVTRDADGLSFVVADTGEGIEEADLKRVMEPFTQARRLGGRPLKGAGLGLSIVRAIADMHDGDVSIESQKGKGTTVILRLPRKCVRAAGSGQD